MRELEQQQQTIREAGRAKRAAARALPPTPRTDDSTPAPAGRAAWYSGNSVSAAGQSTDDQTGSQVKRTDARLRLRDGIQRFTRLDSVRGCETAPIGEAVGIRARAGETTGFAGLMRCGSVWSCPVCAARVRGQRAADLERYASAWLGAGHGLYLVTLTVPHWSHVRLADYVDDKGRTVPGQLSKLLEGWRGIAQGSWWTGRAVVRGGAPVPWEMRGAYLDDPSFPAASLIEERATEDGPVVWKRGFASRYGIAGTTRTAEITDGKNGWHSHLHALVWTEEPASRETAERLSGELSRRWAARCKAVGLPTPDPKVGCRVDPATRDKSGQAALARYIAKVQEKDPVTGKERSRALASELVRGDDKLARGAKGRTAYDLAALAVAGDERARERWWEYERATKGRRCLTWTHGLQERLAELCGDEHQDVTDEELNDQLAEAEARQPNLAIGRQPFRTAVAGRRGGRADVAMAGFVGGLAAVEQLLSRWGLLPGVDFWRIDPLGPGLTTSGPQVTRGREARAAVVARRDAADAVPLSRTPQEWAEIQERRRAALVAAQDVVTLPAADEAEQTLTERQKASENYRSQLRAAKARLRAVKARG
jgi:uncharacterized coiled-coil protein SlyX